MADEMVLDVSSNNTITELQLHRSGAVALIAKATEGTSYQDPTYAEHRAVARSAGVPFGSYVFLHPKSTGDEAAYYLEYAKPKPGDIQPIIDCEVADGQPMSAVAARCNACGTALEQAGFAPILYSSASFLRQLHTAEPALKRFRVWEAQYPGNLTSWSPGVRNLREKLNDGSSVVMWQWTATDVVGGGRFDASLLLADLDSLLIGGGNL